MWRWTSPFSRLSRFARRRLSTSKFGAPTQSPSPAPLHALRPASRSSAQPCEDRHSAIDALRRYLSPENVASDRPLVYSPATLRSLYYRAESRNQLDMLDAKMLTLLIGMFGSLSIDPCVSVVYKVPVASRLLEVSKRRTYWPFVLKVGKYKSESGMLLQDSDRFWLMCAELACIQTHPPPMRNAYSVIRRARVHYHIIRRHSRRPEVHAYYLETLLAIRDPRLLHIVACDLSFLLRTHRACHPQLQRLLYRLVIQHGERLSNRSQEVILSALRNRVCPETEEDSAVSQTPLLNVALDDRNVDAISLAHSVSATLFGFADYLPNERSTTPFRFLFSVFSLAHPLSLRWNSLLLLSIFNSPEPLRLSGMQWTSNLVVPQVTRCWQVIFSLAILDKLSQEKSSVLSRQQVNTKGILDTTHALYQLWMPIMKSGLVSQDLACAVAISFLRISGIFADATLFHDCQGLYLCLVGQCLDSTRTSVQKLLAAQHIAAAARVYGTLEDMVLATLESFSADAELQRQVIASAVQALAPIDPSLAYTFYTAAENRGTEPDSGVTHILAMSLVRRGLLRPAIDLINRGRFSLEERGGLISAIARCFGENPRIHLPESTLVAIVNELAALYHSRLPPGHLRGHLELLFVVLAQHGRGRQLLPLVLSIFERLPNFFHSQFFVRFCHALIRHRQFATANKLLNAITVMYPKVARSLSILTDRITSLRGPSLLRISSRLQRSPHAGPPLARSLRELLKLGRVLAAKHIFARVSATTPSKRCTSLGNILLHGVSRQPTPRNGRRVRKVLALLENLVEKHGFRPDRVTANILIKAMISWRSIFDSPRLRELFDQLVRGGYPAADYSPQRPPFGTGQAPFSGSAGFSKLSSFISFEKHSGPLFKMFIKAFYLCNDVEAARRVVGILKVEKHKNALAKKVRQRARSRGRIRADGKNVTPLEATVSSSN